VFSETPALSNEENNRGSPGSKLEGDDGVVAVLLLLVPPWSAGMAWHNNGCLQSSVLIARSLPRALPWQNRTCRVTGDE
jgi:hypothetical protein